jgi:NADH-quinone oxidoreductase subunit C
MTEISGTTPAEAAQALVAAVGGQASLSGGGAWARGCVTVEPAQWAGALRAARDELGCNFFDWLTAVDELDRGPGEGGYGIVAHVWSTAGRFGLLIRTVIARDDPVVESVTSVYSGANWPERETYEMFGVRFSGHPDLKPLLLPPEFEGHPLRKDFVLASRVVKDWPGEGEPGESHVDSRTRRQAVRPPGVPAPGTWGVGEGEPPIAPEATHA